MSETSKNRPYARQDGYITIIKEADWLIRYNLRRNLAGAFEWYDPVTNLALVTPIPEIMWIDIYVSGLDWGRKPKTIKYTPVGASVERTEVIGLEPNLSFKSALINKQLFKLQGFRNKFRIVVEMKNERITPTFDSFEFKGCVSDDWKASGDSLVEQNVSFSVEELPLSNLKDLSNE
jgi:hypothetical protein